VADLEEITLGDSMTDIEVTIVDPNTNLIRNISGWTARLFLEAAASGDRPASSGNKVTAANDCAITTASDQLTRSVGSFSTDGFVVGMLIIGIAGIPDGAYVKVLSPTAITMSLKATASAGSLRPVGWMGITGQITSGSPAGSDGRIVFPSVGLLLDIGILVSDTYVGKVRAFDGSNSEVGWTNSARGVVQFKAVQP
jgi:hypothetical protein